MKCYCTIILSLFFFSVSIAQVNHTGACIRLGSIESKPSTEVGETSASNSTLYSNPLSEKITIAWNYFNTTLNLSIFDVEGNVVFQRRISNNSTVSLKDLNDGVYLYKLSDGPYLKKSGKLMIRR